MIVSVAQPAYLPWPGAFARIARSDVHVVLDHVQFDRSGFVHRNKVRTSQGCTWLTVPVKRPHMRPINEVEIDNSQPWAQKHWRTLEAEYRKAPYWHDRIWKDIMGLILNEGEGWERLIDLNCQCLQQLSNMLGIKVRWVRSSTFGLTSAKSQLILDLCKEVGATTYLSGPFGRDYLDLPAFEAAGIAVEFDDYQAPVYKQVHGGEFIPGLSIIDAIFNCGPDTLDVIMGRKVLEGSAHG